MTEKMLALTMCCTFQRLPAYLSKLYVELKGSKNGLNFCLQGIIYPLLNPDMSGAAAQVDISNSNLSLQPGASTTVSVRFTPPAGLNKTTFPIYSGYIYILSNDAILLKVPYLGMAAAMRDMSVIDTGAVIAGATLPLIADGNFNIQSGEKTYTFMGASVPSIFLRLVGRSDRTV